MERSGFGIGCPDMQLHWSVQPGKRIFTSVAYVIKGIFFVLNMQIWGMEDSHGLPPMYACISAFERGSKNILFLRGKNYQIGWTCDNHIEESLIS